jgi:hypothetical protein
VGTCARRSGVCNGRQVDRWVLRGLRAVVERGLFQGNGACGSEAGVQESGERWRVPERTSGRLCTRLPLDECSTALGVIAAQMGVTPKLGDGLAELLDASRRLSQGGQHQEPVPKGLSGNVAFACAPGCRGHSGIGVERRQMAASGLLRQGSGKGVDRLPTAGIACSLASPPAIACWSPNPSAPFHFSPPRRLFLT